MRISREEMFTQIIQVVSKRSTCIRKKVGCALVYDNRIIAIGYNGVLPNVDPLKGLDEGGNSKTVHAESNMIAFCAKNGIATRGSRLFVTLQPCEKCAELIVQSGITEVVYLEDYRCSKGIEILKDNNIIVRKYA